MIEVGDLIRIVHKSSYYVTPDKIENKEVTGIVVGTTLEDQRDPGAEDYWVRVVFLDGTKSTLFHDETRILVKNGSR